MLSREAVDGRSSPATMWKRDGNNNRSRQALSLQVGETGFCANAGQVYPQVNTRKTRHDGERVRWRLIGGRDGTGKVALLVGFDSPYLGRGSTLYE